MDERPRPDGGPSGVTIEAERPTEAAELSTGPAGPSEPSVSARPRPGLGFFLIAAAVVTLDQMTKVIIRATLSPGEAWPDRDWLLNIVNVSNSGAAFGILQGQTVFLIVTSLIGVAAIVLYYLFPPLEHGLLRVALGLQLGGAASNLIDRIRFGEVTDFINFDFWPAFNVADASISIGVVTIIWFFLVLEGEQIRRKPAAGG
jgi:signal peptidase II